jgi:uncharacterized protein (UPF0335 family)
MAKRVKKPAVRPEVRKQWLKRFEEDGESPPQIAKADGYDVRTVRKQIDVARQEREAREARFAVLRNALELHYGDLVSFAQKLDSEVVHASLSVGARSDRLWVALRQHLPRSPLWKLIDRMERLNDELRSVENQIEGRLRSEIENRTSLSFPSKSGQPSFYLDSMTGAIIYQSSIETPYQGRFGTTLIKEEMTEIHYGAYTFALVPKDQAGETQKFLAELIDETGEWSEYQNARHVQADRRRVTEAIREELATIILRRIVPGRCKYCPI